MTASGRCACGSVTYEVDGPLRDVYNCHCDRCRRASGHYVATTAVHVDDLRITGADEPTWWTPDGTAEYGFCRTCGSTMFWRAAATPQRISITAGTLDPPTGLRTTTAWFCAEASDYHVLPTGLDRRDHE